MKPKEKIGVSIAIVCITVLGIFITYKTQKKVEELKDNSEYTEGKIVDFYRVSKRSVVNVVYHFQVNGINERGNKVYNIHMANKSYFIGKEMLVVYSSKHISNNQLLMTREDYIEFGLAYPDSLDWVKDYLFD